MSLQKRSARAALGAGANHLVAPLRPEDDRMPRTRTHLFRARLSPRLYRDIEIKSTSSLYDLAAAIVQIFAFDFVTPFPDPATV